MKRETYEPPELKDFPLESSEGQACEPGSSPVWGCGHGNAASGWCLDGYGVTAS